MKIQRIVFLFLFPLVSLIVLPAQKQDRDPYLFACRGVEFAEEHAGTERAVVPSPDSRKRVVMSRPKVFSVFVGERLLRVLCYPDINAQIEIAWSPDSSQFAITYSDGGAIGNFHAHLFQVSAKSVRELDSPRRAARDFRRRYWCEIRGNNLFFLGWTADSSKAMLVAEVYPTGDCAQSGTYRGYLMDARTGALVRRLEPKEADEVENSCRVSGAIPELKSSL